MIMTIQDIKTALKSYIKFLCIMPMMGAFLTSCNDFLTELPNTAIPEKDAMKTLKDAEEVCLGVYSSFKNPALYSGSMIQATEVQADLFYAALGYTNQFGSFYRWEVTPNEPVLQSVYGGLYQIVNRCNFFFDHVEEVADALTTDAERQQLDKFTADVAFMRAYAYSDLVRLFCKAYDPQTAAITLGVPLYLHYREGEEATTVKPRATLEECYKQILEDLTLAEKKETRDGTNTPFVTKGAVEALRARVLLYMCDWAGAEDYASRVINRKVGTVPMYELADAMQPCADPMGGITDEYGMMWTYDTSDEIIWKIAFSTTDMGGSLGGLFMGINSGRYNPNYFPANWLLESYMDYDVRYTTFYRDVTTPRGVQWSAFIKFPGNPEIDGVAGPYYVNMPKLLRLSETYLIRAEALCMQGNKTKAALDDLTALRRKRIRNYGSALSEQSKLLGEIKKERARELIGEGFRLTDLKRWGDGFERTPQVGTIEGPNYNAFKTDGSNPRFTWLIPQHEITASKGQVVQNEY